MPLLPHIINDITDILYPRECASCKIMLNRGELHFCTRCLYRLPKTNTWKEKDNYVARLFWGRIYLENAASFLLFQKGNMVQEILHQFKYRKQKEIGYLLGNIFGYELIGTDFNNVDMVIPVPLHKRKEKKRGYNQSEWIANGMAYAMQKPVNKDILKRVVENESQTQKHKYERWINVDRIFEIQNHLEVQNKHILLVDDVLTTGATLESCAQEILQVENTKLSIATLAVAV